MRGHNRILAGTGPGFASGRCGRVPGPRVHDLVVGKDSSAACRSVGLPFDAWVEARPARQNPDRSRLCDQQVLSIRRSVVRVVGCVAGLRTSRGEIMQIRARMSMSADGYVTTPDGWPALTADPAFVSGESHGIREFLEGCEAALMGRTTF